MQSTARPLVIGRAFQLKNGSLSCPMARAKTPPTCNEQRCKLQRNEEPHAGKDGAKRPNERCEKLLSILSILASMALQSSACHCLVSVWQWRTRMRYVARRFGPRSPRGDTRDRTTRDMLDLCDHKQGAVWTVDARSIRVNAHHH